jgi:cysteine desulfuration protein SufE
MTHPLNDARLNDLLDEFEMLDDWESRYRHVIDLGKALPPFPDVLRTEEAKVRGCASQVWLSVEASGDDPAVLDFSGDSDAHIVRGLLAILLRLYSGRPAAEIVGLDANAAMAALGLGDALSPQRSNGLKSMAERIKLAAHSALKGSNS